MKNSALQRLEAMKSPKKGAKLRLADVAKDVEGFDDLDEFWNASGT